MSTWSKNKGYQEENTQSRSKQGAPQGLARETGQYPGRNIVPPTTGRERQVPDKYSNAGTVVRLILLISVVRSGKHVVRAGAATILPKCAELLVEA